MPDIILHLPPPPSTNRIWRRRKTVSKRGKANYRSPQYLNWTEQADKLMLAFRQYPRSKLGGSFTVKFSFNRKMIRGDLDNYTKALFDYLQSRDLIRNDKDCQGYGCAWVAPEKAPHGCQIVITPLD